MGCRRRILVLAAVLLKTSSALPGEPALRSVSSPEAQQAAPPSGFVQIFNGRDLGGWDANPHYWSVTDTALVGEKAADDPLQHDHEYAIWRGGTLKDFELRLKFRPSLGNSGIDYRAERVWTDRHGDPAPRLLRGYQADIFQDVNTGALYHWSMPGAPYGRFVVVEGEQEAIVRSGEVADTEALHWAGYCKRGRWNDFSIVARGSHVLHRVNGFLVTEFIDNGPYARREGLLGIQIHGGDKPFLNEFKEVYLHRFSTRFGQALELFNGEDLQGWTLRGAADRNTWSAGDGALSNKGAGILYTAEKYTNYVLRFQFRRGSERQSGIALRMANPDQAVPACIRVSGQGNDFNWVEAFGGFKMKQPEHGGDLPPLPRLIERFWNDCEISLNGGELEVKVNDVLRATATGCEETPGHIGLVGLETDRTGIECRNVVLIPILAASSTPE